MSAEANAVWLEVCKILDANRVAIEALALAAGALHDVRDGPLAEAIPALEVATEQVQRAWDACWWIKEQYA